MKTRTRLYGGMRLMLTTGPTLLYDVFRATFPQAANLVAPGIWEGTRIVSTRKQSPTIFPMSTPAAPSPCCCWRSANAPSITASGHTMISNYRHPIWKQGRLQARAEAPRCSMNSVAPTKRTANIRF